MGFSPSPGLENHMVNILKDLAALFACSTALNHMINVSGVTTVIEHLQIFLVQDEGINFSKFNMTYFEKDLKSLYNIYDDNYEKTGGSYQMGWSENM